MARSKRRTMIVKDAVFDEISEIAPGCWRAGRRDVRVTFPADMTAEEALQAGILLATEWMTDPDVGASTYHELRGLGVNWHCMRSAPEDAQRNKDGLVDPGDEFSSGITFTFRASHVPLQRGFRAPEVLFPLAELSGRPEPPTAARRKKRSREELIAEGICPVCRKPTYQMDSVLGLTAYGCAGACEVLLLDASGGRYERFLEITPQQWKAIKDEWYRVRMAEIERLPAPKFTEPAGPQRETVQ
jgi:hypothetical protein